MWLLTQTIPFPPQTSYYHYLIGPVVIELLCHIWNHKATYICKNKRIWKEYFLLHGILFCGWLSHAYPEMLFLTNSFYISVQKKNLTVSNQNKSELQMLLNNNATYEKFFLLKYSTDFFEVSYGTNWWVNIKKNTERILQGFVRDMFVKTIRRHKDSWHLNSYCQRQSKKGKERNYDSISTKVPVKRRHDDLVGGKGRRWGKQQTSSLRVCTENCAKSHFYNRMQTFSCLPAWQNT